jgi:hypothetical protein
MAQPIDLARAETAAFAPTPAHELLSRFVGLWRGPTQLWLKPEAAPEESVTELHAELVLGGRWLRITHQGVALAQPNAGEMLLGYYENAARYELAWVDSVHTDSSIILSTGAVTDAAVVDVLGSYAAGDQRWGWRTRLRRTPSDELLLEMFNISPAGEEYRALVATLARVT